MGKFEEKIRMNDMTKYKKGKIVKAIVTGIETYGVFVNLDEYYSGLIHISEISYKFVKNLHNYVKIGEEINVEILDVDENECHLKLSIKNINYKSDRALKKRKIVETIHGFRTLEYKLPFWIEESKKKYKKIENSIDN